MKQNLTERIPEQLVRRWRNASIFWARLAMGGIAGFFVPIGVALAWLPFRHSSESLQLLVVCLAGVVLLTAWFATVYLAGRFIKNRWSLSRLPVVEISGDHLTVRWNGETIESIVADCHFRRGRAWQMKYAARKACGMPFGDRDLILIDLPPLYHHVLGHVRAHTTVAVGYTDDSMENWMTALGIGVNSPNSTSQAS